MLQQKGKQTGGITPAAVSFPMRSLRIAGGTGVPTRTLEKVARAPSPAFFPSPLQPGYIRRLRRSEAQFIIDGINRRFSRLDQSRRRNYFRAFSIAASA